MAERTTITEICQLGVETLYGTAVPATKKLATMGIDLSPQFEATRVRPMGYKVPTILAPNREWATGTVTGFPTYNETHLPVQLALEDDDACHHGDDGTGMDVQLVAHQCRDGEVLHVGTGRCQ